MAFPRPANSTAPMTPQEKWAKKWNLLARAELFLSKVTTSGFDDDLQPGGIVHIKQEVHMPFKVGYKVGQDFDRMKTTWPQIDFNVNRGGYTNVPLDIVDKHMLSTWNIPDTITRNSVKDANETIEQYFFNSILGLMKSTDDGFMTGDDVCKVLGGDPTGADIVAYKALGNRFVTGSTGNTGATAGVVSGSYNVGSYANNGAIGINSVNWMQFILKLVGCLSETNSAAGMLTCLMPTWMWLTGMNSHLKNASQMGDPKSVYRTGQLGLINGNIVAAESTLLPQAAVASQAAPSPIILFNKQAVGFTMLMNETNIWKAENMAELFQLLMIFDWKVVKPEAIAVGWVYPIAEPT